MKKVIVSMAILVSVVLFSCNSQSKSSSEEIKNETMEVQSEQREVEKQEEVEIQPSAYCQTCGSEISGSPYEAFGRIYCDMQCYADDPTN